ncbi:MAG: flagellar protein FlaG [Betaproteobacteria bacterium ADurb.Bin341]|nr:MAG: flagellar protein FlaG [Betaproteobacteria bacterium ADurb.Bin341]
MSVQSVSTQIPPPMMPAARRGENTADASTQAVADIAKVTAESAQTNANTREQLENAVEAVQKFIEPLASNLQFSIDEETGIRIVKVVDAATKEVIRQIPSEEILQIAKALDRLQGLLFQQKA